MLRKYVTYKDGGLYWTRRLSPAHEEGARVGCLNVEGYRVFGFKGRQLKEHREVFYLHHGYYPEQIDHINGIRDDNRIENLRECGAVTNQRNRSDIKGYRKRSNGKFEVRISHNGERYALGTYHTEEEARRVYLKAVEELYEGWGRARFSEKDMPVAAGRNAT